ncbi:MAG: penicillin acylase family protein [Bacteroidales bacterium]|jgi:penicillin amidase|nr:penicillin acylase family protein [Bacteroidales bacterium]NLM92169.1 penicillin acylase family protein [Bacteroidales bacterium]
MKKLKKILIGLLVVLAVILLAGTLVVRHISHKALPDYNRSMTLEGLRDEVRVYRDELAIPHIYAKNEHDLYFTTGYVMAQDRLWQMDLLRRITLGRLSEIFGEDMANTDLIMRGLRMPEKAAMVIADSEPEVLSAFFAFSNGVNHYIETHQKKLPPEFTILGYRPEPWQPIHSANLIGYMAWDLSGAWQIEVTLHKLRQHLDEEQFKQLLPDMGQHPSYVYPDLVEEPAEALFSKLEPAAKLLDLGLEVFSASNNWVVSGSKSLTGQPILSNDMHLGYNAPGIWYQMHQVVEGQVNVTGVVLPGQPFVVVGHNDRIAWGMTNVYVDDADFYLETLDENNPDRYLYNGQWHELEIRQEKIAIKGGDTLGRELRFTHRGPIVSEFKKVKDQAISLHWSGNLPSNELRSIYLLNRARNWEDFRDALSTMTSVSQNVNYADVDGNIGLQTAVGIPIRRDGNGLFIYSGETDQYDWIGIVPFEEVPYCFNPPEGHLSSANNRTVGDDYPYHIGYQYAHPYRIDRIREMLNEKEKLGPEDFKRMLADFRSKQVERYLPEIRIMVSLEPNLNILEKKALELLERWDGTLTPESGATAIYEQFYITFVKNLLMDEMGEELYKEFLGDRASVNAIFMHVWKDRHSSWINRVDTDHNETLEDLVVMSFRESVQWLEEKLGKDPSKWQWGDIHQITISHPMGTVKLLDRLLGLNKGPFPIGGSYHTVAPYGYSFRNPYNVLHGASQRHIFQPHNWSENYMIIPTGTSGIPASKYYLDQTLPYLNNEFFTIPWKREEVEARAKYQAVYGPTPN